MENIEEAAYNYAVHKTDFRKDVLKEVCEYYYDLRLSDSIDDFKAGVEWAIRKRGIPRRICVKNMAKKCNKCHECDDDILNIGYSP